MNLAVALWLVSWRLAGRLVQLLHGGGLHDLVDGGRAGIRNADGLAAVAAGRNGLA